MRARLLLGVVAAISIAPVAACSDDGPKEGEARFEVDGEATILRQDGERETVDDDADVRVGDEVSIRSGSGTLELDDGTVLELRTGIGGADDTVVLMGPTPVLEAGDLLVTADEAAELRAAETAVVVRGGTAKLSRDSGMAVAVYDADATLDSAGQERAIPALREMQVPALGLPPADGSPIDLDGTDPWDRRLLGAAIDLGDRLEAIAAGYTQNLAPGDGRTVEYFESVLPGLLDEPSFTGALLDAEREVGDTLVGAAIADLGRRGTFAERWGSVFAFRDAGAAWGLVALDQGVDSGPLLAALTEAVEDSPLAIGPTPTTGPPATIDTSPSTTPTTPPTSPTTRPPGPTTPSSPPATFPPDEPGPLEPILDPILDPVGDLLSGLLGGLLGGLFGSG